MYYSVIISGKEGEWVSGCVNFFGKPIFICWSIYIQQASDTSFHNDVNTHWSLSLAYMKLKKYSPNFVMKMPSTSSMCHFLAHFFHVIMNDIHSEIFSFLIHTIPSNSCVNIEVFQFFFSLVLLNFCRKKNW